MHKHKLLCLYPSTIWVRETFLCNKYNNDIIDNVAIEIVTE